MFGYTGLAAILLQNSAKFERELELCPHNTKVEEVCSPLTTAMSPLTLPL